MGDYKLLVTHTGRAPWEDSSPPGAGQGTPGGGCGPPGSRGTQNSPSPLLHSLLWMPALVVVAHACSYSSSGPPCFVPRVPTTHPNSTLVQVGSEHDDCTEEVYCHVSLPQCSGCSD